MMMKSSPRARVFLLFFTVLVLSLALFLPDWANANGSAAWPSSSALAETSTSKGFDLIREATAEHGAYRFTADIEQTLIPRPLPQMIGQTSQRVDMRLDGDVESPGYSRLNLRFEGGAVSGKPLVLENVDGETYLLQDGERTQIENPLSFLGPKVNLLSYLEAAEGVDLLKGAGPEGFTVYGFNIDGPAFDNYVRGQMMSSPDYRPGTTILAPSPALQKMSGRGELWVDGEGIPQRQIIDLELPEASEEYNARVHMVIDFQFEGAATFILPAAATWLQGNPANGSAEEISLRPASETGTEAGFLSAADVPVNSLQDLLPALLAMVGAVMVAQALIFGQRRRWLFRIVSLSLSFVFLATPVFQAAAAGPPGAPPKSSTPSLPEALGLEGAPSTGEESAEPARAPAQPGLVQAANVDPAAQCGDGAAGVDTDNDQLTDQVENCLGTDPLYYDSDRDMITDTVELAGFSFYSQTWYLDPLLGDSNMDGLADFEESPSPIGRAASWDPDNDHIPNPWDDDNDNDGVWDGADQSPFSFTGFQDSFTFTTHVEDSFSGYQYFGLQVRPQDTSHLRYSTSLLDWPYDEKGQLTDLDGSTEDMTIAPMLAITTDQIPEDDLRELYGLTYFTNPDGSNTLYTPLTPVNDGGQIVAFQTRFAYGPETVGAIEWQEVKFVWLVYMAVDHQNEGGILTEIVPVMSYPETFQLTGWDIGKHQDYDYLLLGMPGNPNDDRDIFRMIFGLSSTFMSNQNPDLDEIDQRFGSTNTDPILTWGVPAADVEVYRPDPAPEHPDGAIFDMNREVPRFLTVNGYPTDGSLTSLVIATQQSLGETGLDEHDASATGFDVNLTDIPMATMRHVRMVNLAFKNSAWQTVADDDLIDTIANRHADLSADLAEIRVNYPDVTQTNLEKGIGLMYLQWTSGQTRLISVDGLTIAPNSKSDFEVYTRLDLSFTHLGAFLLAAAGLLREGGGVTIDDPSGMWSYLNKGDSDEFFAPWWLSWAWATGRFIFNTDSNAQVWFSAKAILKVIIGIYLFIWAVRTLVAAAKAGVSVIRALLTGFQLAKTMSSWGSWALTIVAVILYLGLLVVALITANNKYEIRWAITYYVVTIILTLALALLSFIPGGSIVLLLIYLADAIAFFITGESFLEEIYKAIAEAFYNYEFVTNLVAANFGDMDFSITKGRAIHEGTRMFFADSFKGRIEGTKNARTEDVDNSYVYAEFVGDSPNNSVVVVDKNENNSKAELNCQRNDKTQVCSNDVGVEYEFTTAGINIPIKLNGEITAVTIVKECTFGFCEYPTDTQHLPDDLGSDGWNASTLYFDVVPDTLDELWTWNALTNNDADGDGLLADEEAAICIDDGATCLDPNDWDTDGDGLSDDFEYLNAQVYGTNPFDADSDDDGLSDKVEFRQASLIGTADSDGDGLTDDQEVFHQLPDNSWTGGGWTVSVPGGGSYWMFSSPLDGDEDRDGLIDASERDFQTSPFAFDPAPQLTLTGEPLATSPSGATAIYAAPGETVNLGLRLENVSVEPITRTLSLCLPDGLSNAQGGTMQGWQTPPVQINGSCYSWSFAGDNALQRFEVVSTTLTATAAVSGISGIQNIVATLPHTMAVDGTISDTVPLVVDDDLPTVAIASPLADEIIGGGVTAVVVGGISDDASSWVDHVNVTLPGQGTVVVSDTVSPWAATWTLPDGVNGLLNLTAQAVDVTGHASGVDSIQVLVDNYPPVPQLALTDGQAVPGSGGYQMVIPLSGSASDDDPGAAAESGLARIQLSLDDAPWRTVWTDAGYPLTAGWNITWTLPGGESVQGEHVVKTRAYDRAGNLSTVVEKTIVVDVLPPTDDQADRTFVTDPPHYKSGETITLQGVANEAGNLPLAPVPQDLNGTLHSIGDATIWLQADSYAEISNNMTAAWLGDYNGDRLGDLAVGLPAANGGAGKVVVVLGAAGDWPVPDLGRALAESTTSFTGLPGAGLGQLIGPAGDVNGDGFADLIIADQNNDRAFLVFGSFAGRGSDVLLDGPKQSGWVELTTATAANIEDVAGAGDVNGDGYDDLLMSVDDNGGEAYVLLGQSAPPWSTLNMEDIAAAVIDTGGTATVGGVGDINDDQLADYAVGAGNNVTLYAGEIGLANFSRVPLAAGDALATFTSADSQPAIVPLGPVNGDAYDDFIFSNGNGPTVVFGNGLSTQALGGFSPAANGFLAAAGDVDRDGQNDIVIGNANGDAYLLLGSNLSTVAATFTGVDTAASAPYAAGADLNSDGASDLLLVPSSGAAAAVGLEGFGAPVFVDPAWLPQSTAGDVSAGEQGPAFFASAVSAAQVTATTRYVDDDSNCQGQTPCYSSIQAAVNASAAGDTIEVMPGVYSSFTVSGVDDLTIGSTTVADATFVDGAGGTFAAKISSADGVHLANLTLQNAQYGLWLENAGDGGWQTPADKTRGQGLFIYDFTTHAVYMNRQSTLELSQTTMAGSSDHLGIYGSASSTADWDGGTSDSRFATNSGGGLLEGSSKLYFVHGNGSRSTDTYNPTTGSWGTIANAPYKIGGGSTVTIDGNDDIWLARTNDYGEGLNGRIRAVEYVADNRIYVGGDFTQAGGQTAQYVAMWNGSSWESLGSSDGNRPDQPVRALTYDPVNSVLYAGTGQEGNSESDAFLRSWNGSSWTKVGTVRNDINYGSNPQNALVNALDYANGVVWVGGHFDHVQKNGGSSIKLNSITKYTVSSGNFGKVVVMDNRCDPGMGHQNSGDSIDALVANNSYVFMGGRATDYEGWNSTFSSCFPFATGSIARLNIATNQVSGLPIQIDTSQSLFQGSYLGKSSGGLGDVYSMDLNGNRLFIGGDFNNIVHINRSDVYNYTSNHFLILNVSNTTTASLDSQWNFNGIVTGVSARNSRVFVAGHFTSGGLLNGTAVSANRIAFINNSNVLSAMDGGLSSANSYPKVDHGSGNNIAFIGGNFTSVDGGNLATNRFARWDGSEFSGQGFFQYDSSGNSWSSRTAPSAFFGDGTALAGDDAGSIYAILGDNSTSFYHYDVGSNAWSTGTTLPSAATVGATMKYVDGDFYALLGGSNSKVCRFEPSSPGLIGYWAFNEGSGSTAQDPIGGLNGTLKNGANYALDVPSNLNISNPYSVNLDGNNDYVQLSNESAFDLNVFSVSFWVKADTFSKSFQAMVTKGDSSWRIARQGTTNKLSFATTGLTGSFNLISNSDLSTGQWYHVVAIYDGSTKYLYINGSLDKSEAASGTVSSNDYPVMIGENAEQLGRQFDGKIDDVRIYGRALSTAEIAALSNTTPTPSSWDCGLATIPGSVTVGSGASLVWDGQDDLYATIGSNGKQFYSYNIPGDSWTTLGDGSGITTGDDDTPSAVNAGAGLARNGTTLFLAPGGGVGALYRYGPVGQVQQRLTLSDVAIVAPEVSSASSWIDSGPSSSFQMSTSNLVLVGGPSTTWSPDLSGDGIVPSQATHSQAAFLDPGRNLYRLTASSTITAGYHSYRADALVATSGEEFDSIQDAIFSGANQVSVKAGIYEEDLALASGVTVIGAGGSRTIVERPSGSTATAMVSAEGVRGATLRGVALNGDGTAAGFLADTGATDLLLIRDIIHNTGTAIALDGTSTEVEVVNLTVANNTNGLAATNCAPVNVRNSVFAFHSGTGLSYQGCAPTKLHTYNDYWTNGTDQSPLAPGSGEIFLNPLFTDLNNYLVEDASPIIDAGAPGDPSPPGAGSRVDMGYVEQTGSAFYADDNYCLTCANDGLTWQVDAFDNIQDALDAAEAELLLLGTDQARYSVGVGPGTYAYSVTVPSYVSLAGSGAESTVVTDTVYFNGAVHAGLHNINVDSAIVAVEIDGYANDLSLTHNIFSNGFLGIRIRGGTAVEATFNTFVNNLVGIAAEGSGNWIRATNNILALSVRGMQTLNGGQIFSDYNLLYNTEDYRSASGGANDITGQPPLFASGGYRLQPASPAVDAADPTEDVPSGGGLQADMGYWELRARPFTLFLGDDNVSSAVATSGVAQVEYAVVPVADSSLPVTGTLPTSWSNVTLNNPDAPVSDWEVTYNPPGSGYYRLYTRATDVVNNLETDETEWFAGAFFVDGANPVVTWLSPSDGSSTAESLELRAQVQDYVAGQFSVENIHFLVDGQVVSAQWAAEPWSAGGSSPRTFRAWVDVSAGSHMASAVAQDKAGNIGQSTTITFTATAGPLVDSTAPSLTIDSPATNGTWVTGTVTITGTASDAGSGLASVEVSFDDGVSWQAATVSGGDWSLTYDLADEGEVEYVTYVAQARATDMAGNNIDQARTIIVDNVPPHDLLPVTFSAPPGTHFDQAETLTTTWNSPVDGSGVANVYLTVDNYTDTVPSALVAGTTNITTLGENQEWYVHLAAVDIAGNTLVEHFGPWQVGSVDDTGEPLGNRRQTIVIDGFIDQSLGEWTADETLDDDERGLNQPTKSIQTLYATWDGTSLYLGWKGAWWDVDGTFWAYLDTGAGGTTMLVGGATPNVLPFAADLAVSMTDSDTGLLWTYDGSVWNSTTLEFAAQGNSGNTELKIPLAVDQVSTLRLVAFADKNDPSGGGNPSPVRAAASTLAASGFGPFGGEIDPWSVFPTINKLDAPWRSFFEWSGLSNITEINLGQPQAPDVNLALTSPQPVSVPSGPGETISYTVQLTNLETELVSGLRLSMTVGSSLTLQSVSGAACVSCIGSNYWLLKVPNMPAGDSHQIALTAQLASNLQGVKKVKATAELTFNSESLASASLSHAVDGDKPTVKISVPPGSAIASGQQKFYGTAGDGVLGSGVVKVEVREKSGSWQTASGKSAWSALVNVTATSGNWELEARATDANGLVSPIALAAFIVDATAPTITVDLPGNTVPGVVNGSVAPVSGLTRDPYPVGAEVDRVAASIDDSGSWLEADVFSPNPDGTQNWLFDWNLPTEDGVTHTLHFSATDQVGNIGVSSPISVVVDNVAPALAITEQLSLVEFGDSSPVISGTVEDGHQVAQVLVSVYAPDGSSYQEAAILAGNQWSIGISSQPVLGSYHLWITGRDLAGNETLLGPFEIYVVSSLSVSDLEVDEAAGNAIVTVSALNISQVDVSVDYATADDVATEPDDYSAVNGTLVIPAGDLTGTISIPLVDDRLDEPDEPFNLQLSNPVHAVIGDGLGQVLILDDDHTPVAVEDNYGTPQNMTLVVPAPGILENDSDEDGDVITATLAVDASHGQLALIPDGSFTYTPTFNYSGDDAFTYYASDGVNNSEIVTVTVRVNDPPVITSLVLSPTAVFEDDTATLSGTFTDADVTDEHSVWIDWGDLSSATTFSLTVGTRTFSATHHYLDDNPPGTPADTYSITVSLSDSALGNDVVTTTIGVTNVNPLLSVNTPDQTLQYSDFISPTTITVTDVAGDPPQKTGTTWQASDGTPVAGLPGDLSLVEQGCQFPGINGRSCAWVLSGTVQLPADHYTVTATFEDDDTGQSAIEAGLTIEPEAAAITFDGDNPVAVQVTEPGSNASLPFEMVVYVEETQPDLASPAAAPGDIALAEVSMTLDPVGPGGGATGNCTPILIDGASDYDDILKVVCTFDGVPVNTYSVNVVVDGGYYAGYDEDVVVIYDPSLGYTTGGGWFYWPGTENSAYAGYPGDKTNFGYSMSYNQNNLKNVKGSLLLIRHLPDGTKYRIKSNALEGLSIGDLGAYGWASFSGKTTYLEPGMLEPEGNHTFLAYVEDHNQPGNGVDRFWLETQDKDGGVIDDLSMAWPGWANAQMINGGNIVVPHSGGSSNEPPAAAFTYAVTGLSVDFSDASTDPDGTIAAWSWDFGDGNGSTTQDPTHIYAGAGTYTVTLTVTDNDGAIDATSQGIAVTDGNLPPTADFDYSVITRTVTFTDTSSDDGTIEAYQWEFGDGNTATDQHPTHTYAIDGVYDVVLTVTDNDGASDSFGQQVAVSGAGGGTSAYIQSLAGNSAGDGTTWSATVEIRVMDDAGNWVSNAEVSGSWSKGFYSGGSCTTDANGYCMVEQVDIDYKTRQVTFSVDDVTHANLVYDPSLDVVSSIRVSRPEPGQSQATGGEIALVIESTSSEETVMDQDGRRIGLADGRPVLEMPGVSFLSAFAGDDGRVGAFWLPAGSEYTAEIRGYAEEKIDLQVLVPTGVFSGLVIIFEEVQMAPGSVARLVLAGDGGQLSLSVDLDGDGQVDQTILPSQSVEVSLMPPLKLYLPSVIGGY